MSIAIVILPWCVSGMLGFRWFIANCYDGNTRPLTRGDLLLTLMFGVLIGPFWMGMGLLSWFLLRGPTEAIQNWLSKPL